MKSSGCLAMIDTANIMDLTDRPKRLRHDSRHYDGTGEGDRSLELPDILDVLRNYRDYDGGINCSKCGKLYKSKVCFVKHLWEHSVYWDLFAGAKNHERVLAIQAALILSGYHELAEAGQLLVTAPGSEKLTVSPEKRKLSPVKLKHTKKKCKTF